MKTRTHQSFPVCSTAIQYAVKHKLRVLCFTNAGIRAGTFEINDGRFYLRLRKDSKHIYDIELHEIDRIVCKDETLFVRDNREKILNLPSFLRECGLKAVDVIQEPIPDCYFMHSNPEKLWDKLKTYMN